MDDYRWSIIIHFWNENIPLHKYEYASLGGSEGMLHQEIVAASFTAPSPMMWQSCKCKFVSVHLEWSLSTDAKLSTFAMLK